MVVPAGGGEAESSGGSEVSNRSDLVDRVVQEALYEPNCACFSLPSPLQELDDEQMEQLVEALRNRKTEDMMFCYTSGSDWEVEDVRRAASVVSRLSGLRHFRLGMFWQHSWNPPMIDLFLDRMMSDSTAELRSLRLSCFGASSNTWLRFSDRFAPSITTLELGTDYLTESKATRVARTLRRCFASLETLRLFTEAGSRHAADAASVILLLRAVPRMTIKNLDFHVNREEGLSPPEEEKALQVVINELGFVSQLASRSTLLKSLRVELSADVMLGPGNRSCDCSIHLERLMRSVSLEEIHFGAMPFTSGNDRISHQYPTRINNYTVKKMSFDQCRLGEEFLSLVSSFKALETIRFHHGYVEHQTTVPPICSRFDSLLSYREVAGHDYRISFTESILSRAPSLRKVELSIQCAPPPAMEQVVARCSAELSLKIESYFEGSSSVAFLCAGIETAGSLPSLDLTWGCFWPSHDGIASILASVQRNTSLRRFYGGFHCWTRSSGINMDELGPTIESFVSSNSALEFFGFCLECRIDGRRYEAGAIASVFQGLRANRRLLTVDFSRPRRYFDTLYPDIRVTASEGASGAIVAVLRNHNTSLLQIEGLSYESPEHGEQIAHLLALNRHGRDFAANAHRVPLEHWGDVLSRIGAQDCNYFVTKLARMALFGAPSAPPCHQETGEPSEPAPKRPRRTCGS
jgi:hypothetical protein